MVTRNARLHGPDDFLAFEGRRWTHAESHARALRLASALYKAGCVRQDRVSILAMNCPEYLDLFAANWIAGVVTATVNFRLAAPEIKHILQDSAPKVLIFEAQYAAMIGAMRVSLASVQTWICIGDCPAWAIPFEDFLAGGDAKGPPIRSEPEDIALLIYTSGTTGRPKGAMRSHACELACGLGMMTSMDVRPRGRMLEVMPFFHAGAQSSAMAQMWRGGTIYLHRSFDPLTVLQAIERDRLTHLHFVPTMIQALIDHPEFSSFDLSSVETLLYAAAPMPVSLLRRALTKFGPVFVGAWGMTEGGGTFLPKHAHDPDNPRLLASIGQMQQYGEMRIVGDDGRDCEPGQPGEIRIKSRHQFSGYWNMPEATAEAIVEGWLKTGDMGYFDEHENLFLVDRRKDMIISGGENIYSIEVENALAEHAAVASVAVIGVADGRWGEAVRAIVVVKSGMSATEAELIAHAGELIAGYKKPKSVVFADALPVLASGKIDKKALRVQFK